MNAAHLLIVGLLWSSLAQAQSLTLAGDAWPPYTDASLPSGGLSVELIRTALGRGGYTVDYVEMPWERAVRGLRRGQIDLVNDWFTVGHAGYARYGAPFLINRVRWVQRRDDGIVYQGLDSLAPYRVALGRGYVYSDALMAELGEDAVYVADFVQAAYMLAANRVDLTLEDELVARHHFGHRLALVREAFEFLPGEFDLLPLHLVVRGDHPQRDAILATFERELAAMRDDGTYEAILQRHGLSGSVGLMPVPEPSAPAD